MAAKYYCDVCEAPLTEKVGDYGYVEGSGVRSTAERGGRWTRCKLSESGTHFCLICGFGIAGAFVRGDADSPTAKMNSTMLLKRIARWWEAYHVGTPPTTDVAKKYLELEQLAERVYNIVMLS